MIIRLRIALLVGGIGAFAYAMRSESEIARWVGIACVGGALLLRFAKGR